jgi:tetratricopeptide (TPR) repeat protein
MLVGRSRELDRIERALEACTGGRGAMVALCGEAGMGKTRLADELADRALRRRGFHVAWGRAWETAGAPPYWPWIECLGSIAERLGHAIELAPAVRALLSPDARSSRAEGLRADPERERFELFEGVAAFLRAAAKAAPLLIVLDDLHAADLPSLDLLARIARGLRATRIVVLGTYRNVEARRFPVAEVLARIAREADVLPLEPLPREDVAEMVRNQLGDVDAALARRIFDATEGNPLFVREALQALALSPGLASPLELLRDGEGVGALVRSRLGGASEATSSLLEAAAAFGREIDPALLAQVTGASFDAVEDALQDGTARGLLTPRTPRWVFSHLLVREAIYHGISVDRRRALHGRIAGALRERVEQGHEDLLATLAHHSIAALPDGDVALAMTAARRAAERARAQLAHEEAIGLLDRALAAHELHAPDEGSDRAELLIALGWAATEGGRLARGRDVFRQVTTIARRTGDGRLLARAALGQGGAYVIAEVRTELVELLREALAAVGEVPGPGDQGLVARLLARLAGALTPSAEPDEPLGLARRAFAMTRNEPDLRTRIDVDLGAGSALIDFSPPRERIDVDQRLLNDARQIGDRALELRALTRLACAYVEDGDVIAAAATIDARADLSEAVGSPRYRWATPLLRSMLAMLHGRFDDCEALASEASRIAVAVGGDDPNAARAVALHRLCLSVVAGRTDGLAARIAEALRAVEPLGDPALPAWVVAIGAAALGHRDRAIKAIRTVLFTVCAGKSRNIRTMIAHAAAASEAVEESAALHDWIGAHHADEAFGCTGPFAFVCGPPIAHALAATAFVSGRHQAGLQHAAEALAFCERTGARGHEAWVRLTLAEELHRHGDAEAARSHLARATDLATELGMPLIASRAELLKGEAPPAPPATASLTMTPATAPAFTLSRSGDRWLVTCAGRSFALKDVRGIAMIAHLLDRPGQEIHAVELANGSEGVIDMGDAGEVLDARARVAYRARLSELRAEIDQAERFADQGRRARLQGELDALTQQLAGAVGLGGRERRSGSAAERARVTVQRRVREAIKKIAEEDPHLGRHLDWTIRTGTYCAYEPEGPKTSR